MKIYKLLYPRGLTAWIGGVECPPLRWIMPQQNHVICACSLAVVILCVCQRNYDWFMISKATREFWNIYLKYISDVIYDNIISSYDLIFVDSCSTALCWQPTTCILFIIFIHSLGRKLSAQGLYLHPILQELSSLRTHFSFYVSVQVYRAHLVCANPVVPNHINHSVFNLNYAQKVTPPPLAEVIIF